MGNDMLIYHEANKIIATKNKDNIYKIQYNNYTIVFPNKVDRTEVMIDLFNQKRQWYTNNNWGKITER
jgi:predicted nucleic-acid-binding Zn-ribbon protein